MEELETDADDEDDPAEESGDSKNTNPSVPVPATRESAEWRRTVMDEARRFTERESPKGNHQEQDYWLEQDQTPINPHHRLQLKKRGWQ